MAEQRAVRKVGSGFALAALTMALACGHTLGAQGLASVLNGGKAKPAPEAADALGRNTPRDAVYEFLETCHRGNYIRAAKFLDLSKIPMAERATQGPELARELGLLLDRDSSFEVEQLSSTPEGLRDDALPQDIDVLGTFAINDRKVPLYMERVERDGEQIWLVSSDSVVRLPQLRTLTEESALEKRMPRVLVTTKLLATPIWAWLALVLAAIVLSLLSRLLSRVAISLLKPVLKRYVKSLQAFRLQTFTEPVRLLLSVLVFRGCMEFIAPSALLRDYLLKLLALLFVMGTAALVMRVVDVVSDQWMSRLDPRERALSYSVLPLGVRFIKICVFCLAVLVVLNQWGLNITAVLAGVGVGGLAVALAAQKTIENLFGGISVITDRPVLVGDVCQFGGQTGTVEDIGLRSTRIRTPERTLVTVPNSQFSTMTLENLSRRDRMLFKPVLVLRRDTAPEKIQQFMTAIEEVLRSHERVDPTTVPVRFTKITQDGFVLELFSYVLSAQADDLLRTTSELLLQFLAAARQMGVEFAVPFQETRAMVSSVGMHLPEAERLQNSPRK